MCPFCYIGKRKFEKALEQFPERDRIEVEWKSFELMPNLEPGKTQDLQQMLVESKGMDMESVKAMNAQVASAGEQVGIAFDFDKALATNTRAAHRFIHFAKAHGKQDAAEELLFRSFFTEGKDVGEVQTLMELGEALGLDPQQVKTALDNGSHDKDVEEDIYEARQVGVRGVPFFVLNRKYAVSGAQEAATFLQVLEKSFGEWEKDNPRQRFETLEGKVCEPGKPCE